MDVYSLARSCARRWYVFLPILFVFTVLAVTRYENAATTYSATSSLVVLPPNTVSTAESASSAGGAPTVRQINPFAYGSSGDRTAANALAAVLSGADSSQLPRQITGGSYSVTVLQSQPVIVLTSQAATQAAAERVLQDVTANAKAALDQLQSQAGAPAGTYYQVVPAGAPADLGGTKQGASRTLIGLILAGLLLATIAAAGLDAILERRGQARVAAQPAAAASPEHSSAIARESGPGAHVPAT